ncbi:MAG: HAD family hydrolase [Deltaproteobacteria bacterium]|nr:HAD family hydrolase [Deltaproteobacteria bacterium]
MPTSPVCAVTFDFGLTLCDLDTAMLARRLAERAIVVSSARLDGALSAARAAYDSAITEGDGGHPWKTSMGRLLDLAGVPADAACAAVDWLWTEQPRRNLWRRPVAGMIDLARALRVAGVRVGIVSNSEGHLAELVAEIGWRDDFPVVADSGRLGVEKPDPAIFRWAIDRLGVPATHAVHVGDSWAADVAGAIRAGARAVWFRGVGDRPLPAGVRRAHDAEGVRDALRAWGLPQAPSRVA